MTQNIIVNEKSENIKILIFFFFLIFPKQGWQTLISVNQENRPFRCTK
jgi:hypothetical protein